MALTCFVLLCFLVGTTFAFPQETCSLDGTWWNRGNVWYPVTVNISSNGSTYGSLFTSVTCFESIAEDYGNEEDLCYIEYSGVWVTDGFFYNTTIKTCTILGPQFCSLEDYQCHFSCEGVNDLQFASVFNFSPDCSEMNWVNVKEDLNTLSFGGATFLRQNF